jgi:hypothetical protein
MKLAPYGIEIYAAIDAYFRYVVWIYVGVSGMTVVSVVRQYLNAVKNISYYPQVIRSDHKSETALIIRAYLQFYRTRDPNIPFDHIYVFSTSTEN